MNEAGGIIQPRWTTPATVRSLLTTRVGGFSAAPYDSFNLGDHVGDVPATVARNRALLSRALPVEPLWLSQVHGVEVADADTAIGVPVADAVVARQPGRVCVVMTADCLPVLLCDDDGSVVAAAHAGWRGLAAGVLEATIERMAIAPERLRAWLGPAIGKDCFEVGGEVREAFVDDDAGAEGAFLPAPMPGKWLADLSALAQHRLRRVGLSQIESAGVCTFSDARRFYSYRRDGQTGGFASMIWLESGASPVLGDSTARPR